MGGVRSRLGAAAILGVLAVGAGAAGGQGGTAAPSGCQLPQRAEGIRLDPADFTTTIDNPWWPMRPGSRWVYRETAPDGTVQRVVVTVLGRTKLIANGLTARVVRDVVTEDRKPVEVTDDWYAQDRCGNIWYLGEATTEYENGKPVSTRGSFEAGVDGAQARVIMPARPKVGLRYRQEYYAGEAEDRAEVMSLREQVEVPFGHFTPGRVLMTRDLNPLDPKVLEYKFYARGIGPVLAVGVSGGDDREELVRYARGRSR
jgi:hypothetical protein